MNKTLKNSITIFVSLLFAGFFMWLALGDMDFNKIKQSLSQANYFWVGISAFFAVLAYGFRAVRWNLLLEPMGYKIQNSNAFWTIAFGYMMNLTIPRSGEIARATALFGVEAVPVEKSFATIVIERVVDFGFMLIFLLLTLVFNANVLWFFVEKMRNYQANDPQKHSSLDEVLLNIGIGNIPQFYFWVKIILAIIILALVMIILMRFRAKLMTFIKGIFEGLLSVFKMKQRLKFLIYSAGIWGCYFLSAYVICFALEETSHFTMGDGFLIITAGTLGMMVPTSGGAGSFHIAVKLAIAGIFVSMGKSQEIGEEIGLTYAFISHTMQMICMIILGLISVYFIIKNKKRGGSPKLI